MELIWKSKIVNFIKLKLFLKYILIGVPKWYRFLNWSKYRKFKAWPNRGTCPDQDWDMVCDLMHVMKVFGRCFDTSLVPVYFGTKQTEFEYQLLKVKAMAGLRRLSLKTLNFWLKSDFNKLHRIEPIRCGKALENSLYLHLNLFLIYCVIHVFWER